MSGIILLNPLSGFSFKTPDSRIPKFLTKLERMKRMNKKHGANHPDPHPEVSIALIELFWAAEMAEKEIRSLYKPKRKSKKTQK